MGEQISIALSEEDEGVFLNFLRADAVVRIFRWAAPSPELLLVPAFPPRGPGEQSYRLWNTAFPWEPEYTQWPSDSIHDPELNSEYCLKNVAGAPLLEYSRHDFDDSNPLVYGRIYWNTDHAIYQGNNYDIAAFSKWYDHVARWLRKHGTRVRITKGRGQYWLPGAYAKRASNTKGL